MMTDTKHFELYESIEDKSTFFLSTGEGIPSFRPSSLTRIAKCNVDNVDKNEWSEALRHLDHNEDSSEIKPAEIARTYRWTVFICDTY